MGPKSSLISNQLVVVKNMFKSLGLRCRRHTCKIVLITSVIWCIIDFFVLVTYFDCVGLECGKSKLSGKHDSIKFAAKQVTDEYVFEIQSLRSRDYYMVVQFTVLRCLNL